MSHATYMRLPTELPLEGPAADGVSRDANTTTTTADAAAAAAVRVSVPQALQDGFCVASPSRSHWGWVLGFMAWSALIVNLGNVVVEGISCYELYKYLHAPHPDDDSYSIAAVAYLIFVPSLLISVLMALFIAYVLMVGHVALDECDSVSSSSQRRRWCYAVVCLLLFLLSCYPAVVGIVICATNSVDMDSGYVAMLMWELVPLYFAGFAVALFFNMRSE